MAVAAAKAKASSQRCGVVARSRRADAAGRLAPPHHITIPEAQSTTMPTQANNIKVPTPEQPVPVSPRSIGKLEVRRAGRDLRGHVRTASAGQLDAAGSTEVDVGGRITGIRAVQRVAEVAHTQHGRDALPVVAEPCIEGRVASDMDGVGVVGREAANVAAGCPERERHAQEAVAGRQGCAAVGNIGRTLAAAVGATGLQQPVVARCAVSGRQIQSQAPGELRLCGQLHALGGLRAALDADACWQGRGSECCPARFCKPLLSTRYACPMRLP